MESTHHHIHHDAKGKKLIWTIVLNMLITVSQFVGGIMSGSLALLSDALHNFSDVSALLISYVAAKLSKRKQSISHTYGYKRAEILAALVNAIMLIFIGGFLLIEAYDRFGNPREVGSKIVIGLALLSIVLNGLSVLILRNETDNNMNIQSAYLHLFTDMLSSVGVLIGGLLMYYYQIYWVDGIISIGIAIYLILMSWKLIRKTLAIIMQFVPEGVDIPTLAGDVDAMDGVQKIHHVHVWQLNDTEIHLEAHLTMDADLKLSQTSEILKAVCQLLGEKYGINHVMLQPEYDPSDVQVEVSEA